jgi:23S rRNA (guanosine2251-2'-O)-methyltransferase
LAAEFLTVARRRGARSEYLYGLNPVVEALRGNRQHIRLLVRSERRDDRRVSQLINVAERLNLPVEFVDQQQLDNRANGGNHQGVVLETGPFQYVDLDEIVHRAAGRPILVLDHVQDPQNLATLIRTAAAVDVAGIVIQSDRSAQVTPAVVRSSAGLVEILKVARENNTRRALESLKDSGYWAVALESTDDAQNMFTADVPEPTALVVGSEERGISANVLKACDLTVVLPMPGRVESLNAAVAGSVALFELVRRTQSMHGDVE